MPSRLRRTVAAVVASFVVSSLLSIAPAAGAGRSAFVEGPVVKGTGLRSSLIHVRPDASLDSGIAAARDAGLKIGTSYDAIKVFVAYGTPAEFTAVAAHDAIEALEANRRAKLFTDSSHEATRGQAVLDGAVRMPDGSTIDGSGIGVAVVDSGVDGTHPDLANRMGGNVKIVCTTPQPVATSLTGFVQCLGPKTAVPLDDTDGPSLGGHGTHVAGTVAGDGTASDGLYHGAAPGATLYGVSVGTTISVENGLDGLAWVLENHDQVTPAIRVVNNSWGSDHAEYDPEDAPFHKATWKLQDELIAEGVTVVWAAGNASGNGSASTIGGECVNPTPGLICVANYDDKNNGTRSGSIDSTSSRGKSDDPSDWPDVSAPGTQIMATCRLTLPVCNAHFTPDLAHPNLYAELSGTSMASPHVAGIVAQILQANPNLTPPQVENLLEDTAHKFTWGAPYVADPYNSDDTTSFEKGHGLVDVVAAIAAATGGAPVPEPTTTPTPTPTEPAPPVEAVDYYFHSPSGSNNVDQADDSATFDTTFPTFEEYSVAYDVPGLQNAGAIEVVDPVWKGELSQPASSVTVDFWGQQIPDGDLGSANYTVRVSTGGGTYVELLPAIAKTEVEAGLIHVDHTFTKMLQGTEEVPLSLPAGPLNFTIRGTYFVDDAATEIRFDAVDYPSGFSTGETTAPTPTPTETVDPDPTGPPPPSGERGTYPTTPDDPYFNDEPVLSDPQQWAPQKIQAPQAWQEAQATGHAVNVAVLDSGVDLDHEDLQCPGKLLVVPGSDFTGANDGPDDVNSHGTHVAGSIGACTNNGTGIAGVAPDTTIIPIQVLDAEGSGTVEGISEGIKKAADSGAHVINMSLSLGVGAPGSGAIGWVPGFVPEIDAAVEYANSKGVVVVAAAGNETLPLCEYPAIAEDVVCVGATDNRDLKSYYSGFPNKPDNEDTFGPSLVAPGGSGAPGFCDLYEENILSTVPAELDNETCTGVDAYANKSGTSMATPHVAGVAALVYDRLAAVRSPENRAAVVSALTSSAVDLGAPGYDPVFGSGRVDALAAVQAVDVVAPEPTETPVAAPTVVEFTQGSATAAQYSDEAVVEAALTSANAPIANQDLVFELTGAAGTREWTVATDAAGIATKRVTVNDDPGSYQLTVRYAGRDGVFLPSADTTGFVVDQDDSDSILRLTGGANDRSLSATTTDRDSGTGLAGVPVEFFADGKSIGTATTDAGGNASAPLSAKVRNGHHTYEVVFAGNAYYERSAAKQQT
jgi:serine protease AprX